MDDLFFGLECFRGKDSLYDQLAYLHSRLTALIDSGCEHGPRLRTEFIQFEEALVGCVTHARRLEGFAQVSRGRLPKWMRYNSRGGV